MKKSTVFLLSSTLLFLGMIIGFLCSPVKHGVSIGNHSGNNAFPKSGSHACFHDENEYEGEE